MRMSSCCFGPHSWLASVPWGGVDSDRDHLMAGPGQEVKVKVKVKVKGTVASAENQPADGIVY